jgi:hypothetical protein
VPALVLLFSVLSPALFKVTDFQNLAGMSHSIYVKAVFNASFVIELKLQMMKTKNTATPKLYIGIDMHKSSWTVRMSTDLFQGRKLRMPSDPEKLYDHVSHNYPDHEGKLCL